MTLRVYASRLSVSTENGLFTHEATFSDGLNFLRAENNMGKTTVLMSLLYALGWEGMLGPSREAPFTAALTREIAQADGVRTAVLESSAAVELGGSDGRRLTLQRPIVSQSEKAELVHSWDGPALTNPRGSYEMRDYYVRLRDAARREAGLHYQLAQFIGWQLPDVTSWDGASVKLYSEILAPFLFVEQTRGWAWIAAVMPRYLRVRDPERRATEFLLSLDSLTRAGERDAVVAQRDALRAEWREAVSAFRARVEEAGGLLKNVPPEPTGDWPPAVAPAVHVLHGDEWRSMSEVLESMRDELVELSQEIPRVEDVAEQITSDLRTAEERAAALNARIAAAARDVREQHGERSALDERLTALREDRARYDDAIRLRNLGSLAPLATPNTLCPTCDQHLPATLVGGDLGPVMTLEDNRSLIAEEVKTFGAMREDADRVLLASRQRKLALIEELNEVRQTIRSLKSTLTQSGTAPSRAAIAQQVRLGDRIAKFEHLEVGLAGLEQGLADLAERYRRVSGELGRLGEQDGTSPSDHAKLEALAGLIREQLHDYGFSSVPPDEIRLSPDTYLPARNDVPLRPDEISASDRVRMVWAYSVGLLEMARRFDTAHPGLLVLDEPGQQEINDASLRALFVRLASAAEFGQQVIVATSKPADLVRSFTGGSETSLLESESYTLQPSKGNGPDERDVAA